MHIFTIKQVFKPSTKISKYLLVKTVLKPMGTKKGKGRSYLALN
jgi:hypothetical protein